MLKTHICSIREAAAMRIDRIDHFVITVADPEATVRFYCDGLGMELVTFAGGRQALAFGQQKINIHVKGKELEPKAQTPLPGSSDFCLISSQPLEAWVTHLSRLGYPIELPPSPRTGATGPIRSIYLRDPDGNLVEISNY
jgi:catechol 2,3-dioxygenase-like lactoylglutathione lyase family enzyme